MNKTILLIDDDEDEQVIFTEALKEVSSSIKCIFAITAEEGLKLVRHLQPSCVFLDINMPMLNGFECLEYIKKDEHLDKIPVVIYSTGINKSVSERAIKEGATACIKKEGSIHELASSLKKFLS